jgi:hypothetical protein
LRRIWFAAFGQNAISQRTSHGALEAALPATKISTRFGAVAAGSIAKSAPATKEIAP